MAPQGHALCCRTSPGRQTPELQWSTNHIRDDSEMTVGGMRSFYQSSVGAGTRRVGLSDLVGPGSG